MTHHHAVFLSPLGPLLFDTAHALTEWARFRRMADTGQTVSAFVIHTHGNTWNHAPIRTRTPTRSAP